MKTPKEQLEEISKKELKRRMMYSLDFIEQYEERLVEARQEIQHCEKMKEFYFKRTSEIGAELKRRETLNDS